MAVRAIPVPAASAVHPLVHDATYHDAFEAALPDASMTAVDAYCAITAATPGWINALMDLRNGAVRRLGLKDVGRLGRFSGGAHRRPVRPGDRLDIFRVLSVSDDDLVIGETDRHLDVRVGLHRFTRRHRPMIALSTVVHVHNGLGTAYMAGVRPFHRLIVRRLLTGFERSARTPRS